MKVREIMTKNFLHLCPEDNVSKFISLMEKYRIREILVCDNKKLRGIIKYRDLAKKTILDPTRIKIKTILDFPPPVLNPNQDIDDAADTLFKSDFKCLPVCKDDKVIGLVRIYDLIRIASKTKDFRQTKAEAIMSLPEIIDIDTDIGKARTIMREKNVSRLPVVDNNKLTGIVTVFDLTRSLKPRERMGWYSMGAEKERIMGIPVSTIMNNRPIYCDRIDSLNNVTRIMLKNNIDGIIVTDASLPIGIITAKDLLEFYVSGFKAKGIYYQIIGLVDESDFVVDTVDRMIRDTIQRLAYVYKPKFFLLHVKRYETGGRTKYSVRTRFLTNKGTFVSKAYAWDLRDAADEALDRLEKIIIKEKRTIKDKVKRNVLRLKTMFK